MVTPLPALSTLSLPVGVSVQHKLHLGPQLGEAICRDALWDAVCGGRHASRAAVARQRGSHRVVRLDSSGAPLARRGWQLLRVLDQPRHRAPVPPESAQLVLRRADPGTGSPASRQPVGSDSAQPHLSPVDLARRLSRSRHLLLPADAQALRVVVEDDGHQRILRVRRRRRGGGVLLHDLLHGDGLAAWMGLSPSLASWMLPGLGGLPPGTIFSAHSDSWDTRSWSLRCARGTLPGILDQQAHLVVRSTSTGRALSADLCLPIDPRAREAGERTVHAVRERLAIAGLLRALPRRAA